MNGSSVEGASGTRRAHLDTSRVLYWIYAARLIVALGVFGAAVLWWELLPGGGAEPEPLVRTIASLALAVAGVLTPPSYWYSHKRGEAPGLTFLYGQALLDLCLVTAVVHLTGGSASVFPALLYIALVSGYALLLPLESALVVALAAATAYLLDVALAYPDQLDLAVLLQIVIFALVALVSGLVGARLRQVRRELSDLERELRRLRLGTSDILRTIESGVITLDETGQVAYMNPAAEDLLGLSAETVIGRNLLVELTSRAPGIAAAARRTLEHGQPVKEQDVEIHNEDGSVLPAAVSAGLLERPDDSPLVTLVIQDMRLARRLEDLHLRASRLEAVAELSASMAHEIKNPLASIRSAVEQVADPASDKEDRAVLGRLIVRETERLSRLLGDFNDFARVDVVQREPIDLKKLVEGAVALVLQRPEAEEGVSIEMEFEEPLDDLWGDPDLVHRTLANLILNAVQVGATSGNVTVRVIADSLRPDQVPRELAPGVPVRIRVIDDGPGIDPSDLERIFDPFYTRREGGSGMGLAIAHRAVQAHGGALLVSSRPGQGAMFAAIFPRRDYRERRQWEQQGWTGASLERARSGETAVNPNYPGSRGDGGEIGHE
jgi:two-component system sensor histidine kinase PilS (NtrC family)